MLCTIPWRLQQAVSPITAWIGQRLLQAVSGRAQRAEAQACPFFTSASLCPSRAAPLVLPPLLPPVPRPRPHLPACLAAPSPPGEPDFSKKHALETKWTLWFDNPNGKQKQATWGQTLRAVYTFDTVEDFWW